jgi:transcriptional regulator with XRE-family HTH domain
MIQQTDASERALGERIRTVRDIRGWTQKDLASRSGLNGTDLADIELGLRYPSLEELGAIARCLGIPVSDLLAGIACL